MKPDKKALKEGLRYRIQRADLTAQPIYLANLQQIVDFIQGGNGTSWWVQDLQDLQELDRLLDKRAKIATHSCNGDVHPNILSQDKNAHSAEWDREDDIIMEAIRELALACGYKEIYWPGLYPVFVDQNGHQHFFSGE